MESIKMELDELHNGALNLYEGTHKRGEMLVSVSPEKSELMVFHTEVSPESSGKGYAGKLLAALVAYARAGKLMIQPLCPYVLAQFKRHPELYEDIWLR